MKVFINIFIEGYPCRFWHVILRGHTGADPGFVWGGGGQRYFADIAHRSRGGGKNLGLKIRGRGGGEEAGP